MNVLELASTDYDRDRLMGSSEGRSTGLHLSDITSDIMRQLEPDRFGGPMHEEFIAVGLAWEDWFEQTLPGSRPGEFTVDGIAMSPDFIHDDGSLCELKVTWVSMKDGLLHQKLARYHMQAKSYCRALGTDTMRFYILWICGDYKPPFPALRYYEVTYTALELEENWNMILTHAQDIGLL